MLKDYLLISQIIEKAHPHQEQVKTTIDGIGVGITVGALMEILPAISAALTAIWLLFRIYETLLNIKAKRNETRRED